MATIKQKIDLSQKATSVKLVVQTGAKTGWEAFWDGTDTRKTWYLVVTGKQFGLDMDKAVTEWEKQKDKATDTSNPNTKRLALSEPKVQIFFHPVAHDYVIPEPKIWKERELRAQRKAEREEKKRIAAEAMQRKRDAVKEGKSKSVDQTRVDIESNVSPVIDRGNKKGVRSYSKETTAKLKTLLQKNNIPVEDIEKIKLIINKRELKTAIDKKSDEVKLRMSEETPEPLPQPETSNV